MTISLNRSVQNKYFYILAFILVSLEFLIMLLIHYVHAYFDSALFESSLDVILLIVLGYPLLMKFVMIPYSKENNIIVTQELNEKTEEIRELNLYLEKKVLEKTREITQSNDELQAIWNIEKNIMIFIDDKKLIMASKSFFEFFNEYKTVEDFNKAENCICNFFEKLDGKEYLTEYIDDIFWTEYISKNNGNFKVAINREDGQHFFAVNAQKISENDNKKLIITFNDITEQEHYQTFLESYQETLQQQIKEETDSLRKKDEIMLAQSRQAAMGDMISMIAHQWRQPITAIGMGAQNMQLDIELEDIDPERFNEKLAKIVEQTHFLSKTIDDFRDFLKPNKKPNTIKLSETIKAALDIIGKSLEHNNITLYKSFVNDAEITTYSSEVIQVLLNIIGNSKDVMVIKNMKDGIINIIIKHDEENAYIDIFDNAGGIPDDVLPRIFEPYFTTKEEKGGTGLGLYMSKMIIEKHLQGTIKAKNIDGGASFCICIPIKLSYES